MGKSRVMPKASNPGFTFICGSDDFLVGRLGQERFTAMATAAGADDFSREIVNGFAGNVDEVETAVNRFRDAVQTMAMFGGKRVVWLKDVSFLADNVTGRAEGTLKQVEALQEDLEKVNADEVSVLVTAAPLDRRRSFPKWAEAHGDFTLVGGGDGEGAEALAAVALAEARAGGVTFGGGGVIEEAQVIELTPNMAEGDFFEAADRFFAGDLAGTLGALERHFFAGGDARQ